MIDRFRLKVFATLAERGSFSAAARALGISQPAVSQNVAELEKYAGARLLCRSRGGVSLTWKGRQFLSRAEAVLAAYRALEESCKAPQTILLCNVLHEGKKTNILIDRGFFADMGASGDVGADRRIDASGLEIRPLTFDCDADLDTLPPAEAGVGFFAGRCSDFQSAVLMRESTGLRVHPDVPYQERALVEDKFSDYSPVLSLPALSLLRQEELKRAFAFARKRSWLLRVSLAQKPSITGEAALMSPLKYLDSLGLLSRDVLLSDCSMMDEEDWRIASRRSVTVVHCPSHDLALSSVRFPYEAALSSGTRICLGGRGEALREEIKAARLLSSMGHDPVPYKTLLAWATKNGADAFGIDAGEISYGKLADAVLALPSEDAVPAEAASVRYVICRGQVLFDFRSHHNFDEVA